MAGVVGIDPRPFSFWAFAGMGKGRERDEWGRTASLMALMFNCHRDPKKTRPATPAGYMPPGLVDGEQVKGGGGGIPLNAETIPAFEGVIKQAKGQFNVE